MPINTSPLEVGKNPMRDQELRYFSLRHSKAKSRNIVRKHRKYGSPQVSNNIYTSDDYIFLGTVIHTKPDKT